MDSLRGFSGDDASPGGSHDEEEDPVMEAPPEIGSDERRMHVRAYNFWVSLLDGRPYPSITDLEPNTLDDFGPHSVLLDFTDGGEDPKVAWLGNALREECDLIGDIRRISDVPKRSLLSRLTDHYLQIIANCAPIGFEAEFVGQRGQNTLYRGILMPFSSEGETIDFIYGVINWKLVAEMEETARIQREAAKALAEAPAIEAGPVWADGPSHDEGGVPEAPVRVEAEDIAPGFWDNEPVAEEAPADDDAPLPADAGPADHLVVARASADALRHADTRSRAALYRALGRAYDFALAAEGDPAEYAELLEDAGLKAQARAPMTPVAKLVFGADADKSRITEFAAALSWARRGGIGAGGFAGAIENFDGGLKAVIQAERRARRGEDARPEPLSIEAIRDALRDAAPIAFADGIDLGGAEYGLLIARAEADGRVAIIGIADQGLTDKALRKAA